MLKHINCTDAVFQPISRVRHEHCEVWDGYWHTIGAAGGLWPAMRDCFIVYNEQLPQWLPYKRIA